jgi:hypothetical protein
MRKRLFTRLKYQNHGQGFVELMLVIPILVLMLAAVVEYGMLLNNYLKVLDATREGARLASQMIAFNPVTQLPDQRFFVITASKSLSTMTTFDLNGNMGDDLIISVFSVTGETINLRFPDSNGWSLCFNYSSIMADPITRGDIHSYLTTDQYNAFVSNWNACARKNSKVTNADIVSHLVSTTINSGIVLVEAYYNYSQMLKLPVIEQLGDPIPVFTYSLMPMGSAMPTPVPIP